MADEVKTQRGPPDPGRGAVEPRELDPRRARAALLGIAALVTVVIVAVALLLRAFGGLHEPGASAPAASAVPLQADERGDRAAIEARSAARLAGRGGGVPIDEAMRRTAETGWDAP